MHHTESRRQAVGEFLDEEALTLLNNNSSSLVSGITKLNAISPVISNVYCFVIC